MRGLSRFITFTALAACCCAAAELAAQSDSHQAEAPQTKVPQTDVPTEQIELKNRKCYSGLIESEDADWLTFICIQRKPGEATHLVVQPFAKTDIGNITRLGDEQRSALQATIEEFRNRASIEAMRMESIRLRTSQGEGRSYRHYQTKWFSLDSTADEASTRRVIVRAEQVFAAYRQIMPPRTEPARPLRLIVLGSMDEYQALLAKLGVKTKFANPACFLKDQNTVVIGSELGRIAAANELILKQNDALIQQLRDLESQLPDHLRKLRDSLRLSGMPNDEVSKETAKELFRFKQQIQNKEAEVKRNNLKLQNLFAQNTRVILVRLYHEAFHAYLRNWVYPQPQYDIPPWLDEGLAVLFEGGLLEGNAMRVDAANPAALKKLREDMNGPAPLALKRLLTANQGQFLILEAARPAAIDRYYVNAWGLTYYLTFEKHLLTSPALEQYLDRKNAALPAEKRLQLLTGTPPAQLEQQWRAYIEKL